MSDEEAGGEDRTEEATPERRDEFRERGEVPFSKDLTGALCLAAATYFLAAYWQGSLARITRLFVTSFEAVATKRIDQGNILDFAQKTWYDALRIALPVFLVIAAVAIFTTLAQTRLNFAWERIKPDWNRLNPFTGILNLFNMHALVELAKSIAKVIIVGLVTYLVLRSEWTKLPALMLWPIGQAWQYWGKITDNLFWSVTGFLLLISGLDYLYNFISLERKVKMTKQEVKEDFKKRELDPHLKGRMRRMQRDIVNKSRLARTKKATALITNPTHFSVAIKYELGDRAPIVLAKGEDDAALAMRQVARDVKIPIIENKPLARALYAQVEEGEEIPSKFYAAVAEIIKYVFKLKGRRLPQRTRPAPVPSQQNPPPSA